MERLSLFALCCPAGFRVGARTIAPGEGVDFDPADWADALVVVECGELEIECVSGAYACFGEGALLVFAGLTVRRLRNAGPGPLVLSTLSRDR